jgi:hypothetical protein
VIEPAKYDGDGGVFKPTQGSTAVAVKEDCGTSKPFVTGVPSTTSSSISGTNVIYTWGQSTFPAAFGEYRLCWAGNPNLSKSSTSNFIYTIGTFYVVGGFVCP